MVSREQLERLQAIAFPNGTAEYLPEEKSAGYEVAHALIRAMRRGTPKDELRRWAVDIIDSYEDGPY